MTNIYFLTHLPSSLHLPAVHERHYLRPAVVTVSGNPFLDHEVKPIVLLCNPIWLIHLHSAVQLWDWSDIIIQSLLTVKKMSIFQASLRGLYLTFSLPTNEHNGWLGKCFEVLWTINFTFSLLAKPSTEGKYFIQWIFPFKLSIPKSFPVFVAATIILCNPKASRTKPAFCVALWGIPNPTTVKKICLSCRIWLENRRTNAPRMSPSE